MFVKEILYPVTGEMAKVTNWPATMALPLLALVQLVPPQARAAPVPLVVTPGPRVSPVTVTPVALVMGGSGEIPKFVCPLTSHPASVTMDGPLVMKGPILIISLIELFAVLVSPPPVTLVVLVTV